MSIDLHLLHKINDLLGKRTCPGCNGYKYVSDAMMELDCSHCGSLYVEHKGQTRECTYCNGKGMVSQINLAEKVINAVTEHLEKERSTDESS